MTPAAERVRRHRKRLSKGRRVMRVEVDFDHLPDVLVAGGHLDPLRADDPDAVRRAIERLLSRMVAVSVDV
jgi:hypothetical protein